MGRPSSYTQEIADEICERLARGEPLARICEDDHIPHFSTVYRWERDNDDFREASLRAREVGTHYIADDCIRISDDATLEPADKRVRVDTRLRLIGKWNARKYGEATLIKHADSEGEKLVMDEVSAMTRLASLATILTKRLDAPSD